MTAPHYYSSTSGILLGAFERYGMYLLSYAFTAALLFAGKAQSNVVHKKAEFYARAICSGFSAGVSTVFLGLESKMIDDTGREALSAAMGVDPARIEFSDYAHCNNTILRSGAQQFLKLQKYRYGTDMLFMLPSVVDGVYKKVSGKPAPSVKAVGRALNPAGSHHTAEDVSEFLSQNNITPIDVFLKSSGWMDMSPYAMKAGYWAYETFMVQKTSYYEMVKILENIEGTGKNLSADDLWAVYQRIRRDKGQDMAPVSAKEAYAAMWPLLERVAEAYNKHDEHFKMASIVYLLGEGKINIFAEDGRTISQDAVARSNAEIDRMLDIGLDGIREENRRKNAAKGFDERSLERRRSFVDRVTNGTMNAVQSGLKTIGWLPKRPVQPLSPRDPAGLTELSSITPNTGNGMSR